MHFSKFHCAFRKNIWYTTLLTFEDRQWKKTVDNKKVFSAILTDLSKAFDWIYHDLLIAKFNANGLSLPALKIIQEYLLDWKEKQKLDLHTVHGGKLFLLFFKDLS